MHRTCVDLAREATTLGSIRHAAPLILPSFAAGEISPALHGRVDLAKYQVGLATCLNWFIHPFGGASTRAGTEFVGEAVDPAVRSRLIPFQFNTTEPTFPSGPEERCER